MVIGILTSVIAGTVGMVLGGLVVTLLFEPPPWYYWPLYGVVMGVISWRFRWFE